LFTNDFDTVAILKLLFQTVKVVFIGLSLHSDISVFQIIVPILANSLPLIGNRPEQAKYDNNQCYP